MLSVQGSCLSFFITALLLVTVSVCMMYSTIHVHFCNIGLLLKYISELIFQKVASTQDLHPPLTLPLVTSDTHRWSAPLALLPWHAPDCQRVPGIGLFPQKRPICCLKPIRATLSSRETLKN